MKCTDSLEFAGDIPGFMNLEHPKIEELSEVPEEEFSLPVSAVLRQLCLLGKSSTLSCWKVRSRIFGQQDEKNAISYLQ